MIEIDGAVMMILSPASSDIGAGNLTVLERALPSVRPVVASALRGGALYRACHDTACRTRVQGAAGFRRMTRDEMTSEVARRSAELTDLRRKRAPA